MAPDPLRDRLLATARDEVERLPYALDAKAVETLDATIERGVARMRAEGRTGDQDVALAERHLRGMLQQARARVVLRSHGEPLILADGLESAFKASHWWPF